MKHLIPLLFLASVAGAQCLSVGAVPGTTDWFVDVNTANPPGLGTKDFPFSTLGAALTSADDDDRVFVAPGSYTLATGETFGYQVGANALRSQLNVQIIGTGGAAATILDGQGVLILGNGMIRFRTLAAGSSIRGFTFRGYAGTLACIRLGSTSAGFEASDVEISHCIFEGSTGSGIATFGASDRLSIHDNLFLNNNDNGMWASDVTTNANPCSGASGGGEIYNNTFVGNLNAIRLQGGTWSVFNNIVVNSGVNGIYAEPAAVVAFAYTLGNNCTFGNGADYAGGLTPGAGALTADPLFVNAAGLDFHLAAGSPCIDAGNGTLPPDLMQDFDNDPRRLVGSLGLDRPDIGMDEVTDVSHTVSAASLALPVLQVDVFGPAGDQVIRGYSFIEGFLPVAGSGALLLDFPTLTILDPAPVPIPASGNLVLLFSIAGLPPSTVGLTVYSQAAVIGPGGTRFTNNWLTVICP